MCIRGALEGECSVTQLALHTVDLDYTTVLWRISGCPIVLVGVRFRQGNRRNPFHSRTLPALPFATTHLPVHSLLRRPTHCATPYFQRAFGDQDASCRWYSLGETRPRQGRQTEVQYGSSLPRHDCTSFCMKPCLWWGIELRRCNSFVVFTYIVHVAGGWTP